MIITYKMNINKVFVLSRIVFFVFFLGERVNVID